MRLEEIVLFYVGKFLDCKLRSFVVDAFMRRKATMHQPLRVDALVVSTGKMQQIRLTLLQISKITVVCI